MLELSLLITILHLPVNLLSGMVLLGAHAYTTSIDKLYKLKEEEAVINRFLFFYSIHILYPTELFPGITKT